MRRGTTPTHLFTTGVDLTGASVLWLTYKQGSTKLTKTLDDITIDTDDNTKFRVTLTQEETLQFNANYETVEIQLRALMANGSALGSSIIKVPVERILQDGEIA